MTTEKSPGPSPSLILVPVHSRHIHALRVIAAHFITFYFMWCKVGAHA